MNTSSLISPVRHTGQCASCTGKCLSSVKRTAGQVGSSSTGSPRALTAFRVPARRSYEASWFPVLICVLLLAPGHPGQLLRAEEAKLRAMM